MEQAKIKELSRNQKEIDEKENEIILFAKLKREKTEELVGSETEVEDMENLTDELNRMKADRALGLQPDEVRTEMLMTEIQQLKNSVADGDELNSIIAGLESKLSLAEGELDQLKYNQKILLESSLREEMEQLGKIYIDQAENLVKTFRQIMALNSLHKKVRGHAPAIASENEFKHEFFRIPIFSLESIEQHPNQSSSWPCWNKLYNMVRSYHELLKEDVNKIKSEFADKGINL